MKFRTKIYLSLSITAVASVLVALSIDFLEARRVLLKQIASKALSIAASAAVQIESESVKGIQSKEDMNKDAYIQVRDVMRKIQDANQREDVFVRYMYIVRPSETNKGSVEFVVDAARRPEETSVTGTLASNRSMNHILQHLMEFYAPTEFVPDPFGYWLSAYAPIYDANHNYVATLGIDLYAKRIAEQLNMLLIFGLVSLSIAVLFAVVLAYFLARKTTQSLHILVDGVEIIGKGNLDYHIQTLSDDEFQEVANAINQMCKGLKEKERLMRSFSRYVSDFVLDKILKSDKPLRLEGEKKKITVLFSDIKHFTSLAEKLPPEQVVAILNEYFESMLDVIFKNHGTLDKFIGDGIMVEFGSPLPDKDQEKHAAQCALEMQSALQELSRKWEKEGKPTLTMGIGIHTGEAIVGNIGTLKRMDYTAIGDTVNVASRIERETRTLDSPILVSETTWEKVKDEFEGKNLGEVMLRGRVEKMTIYSINGRKG